LSDRQFDPGNRHSVSDPLDLLAPSVPNVGGLGPTSAGAASSAPQIDPFPYGSPEQHSYDPYAHAPMNMPDARDYGGYGGYGHQDGGYGVAAGLGAGAGAAAAGAGAAAYGAGAGRDRDHDYASSQDHGSQSQQHYNQTSPAAAAKQREAGMERQRARMSGGYDGAAGPSGNRYSHEGPMSDDRRTSTDPSTVYQHTDYGSVPDEDGEEGPSEIPPK